MFNVFDKTSQAFGAQTEDGVKAVDGQFRKAPVAIESLSDEEFRQTYATMRLQFREAEETIERLIDTMDTMITQITLDSLEDGVYTREDIDVLEGINVCDLPLSAEAVKLLQGLDIRTLADMCQSPLPNIFRHADIKGFEEIAALLDRYNL